MNVDTSAGSSELVDSPQSDNTPGKVECRGQPGRVAPLVDFNRCEAQADCERVCPYNVFEVRPIEDEDRAKLSLRGKIKTWVHGANKAYTPNADNCHACKLCLDACPENAITLVKLV